MSDITFSLLTTEIRRDIEIEIAENKFLDLHSVLQSDQAHHFYDVLIICVVYHVCVCPFFFFLLPGEWTAGVIISTAVGWSLSVGLGLLCCIYVATLHENDLWFSNIKVRVLHSLFHH